MAKAEIPTADSWLKKAQEFYAAKNMIGALSSVRNALRLDVRNLAAWHLGCDIHMLEDKQYKAERFGKALKRFAARAGAQQEVSFAEQRLAEITEYYATQHRLWGETDLTHFAARGDLEKVGELLESGVDVNERNQTNWTALHRVGMRGKGEMARLLVGRGADLEAEDDLHETPLIKACTFGNKELIPVLLELGANVNHVAKEKHTALWYAISSMKDVETVKLLVEAGADPNEMYEYGDNPFLLAICAQSDPVAEYLLPLTKDAGRINKHGVSALHFCASYDNAAMIRKLLARGVDVNSTITGGVTALMDACQHYRIKSAQVLLEHGALVNTVNEYGETARSIAERQGHVKILELLNLAEGK